MSDSLGWLSAYAAKREADGLRRQLRVRAADDGVLDLAGNDYLGLSRDPRVVAAGVAALQTWGAGAGASRIVSGTTTVHADLEDALAQFAGTPAALVFSSGYLANLGAVTALTGVGDLIVSDAYVHASLVDACRLTRATVHVVPHCAPQAVAARLAEGGYERALVVTDSVFSVDGDIAPLAELHAVARRFGATLLVDEAHALGTVGPDGRGALAAAGLAGEPDVVMTATLSKSLGAQGGAVLATQAVCDHLVDTARTFIFDTALAPAAAAAAHAALDVLRCSPELAESARINARAIAAAATVVGLDGNTPQSAVVAISIGDPRAAVAAGARLLDAGIRVGVFRPPSVPDGVSRLRIVARADLTEPDLDRVAAALSTIT